MTPLIRSALLTIGFLAAAAPSWADSQSSNSSSNCSDGRCQRVESFIHEDHGGRRGTVRTERWREDNRRRQTEWRRIERQRWHDRRRGRDDDDD